MSKFKLQIFYTASFYHFKMSFSSKEKQDKNFTNTNLIYTV